MKNILLLFGALATVLALNGCATAFSPAEYNMDIQTNKPDVTFKVYNRKGEYIHQGKTPERVNLKSQSSFFTNEIYTIKTSTGKQRKLTASMSPFYLGNVFTLIGFVVDGLNGTMWALPARVNLDKPEGKMESKMSIDRL